MGKMERAKSAFERGSSGISKIVFSTNGEKVQIKMQIKVKDEVVETKTFVLDRADCPDNIEIAHHAGIDWMCKMSSDNKKLMSFHPAMGAFVGKTKSFISKENEEPQLRVQDAEFVKDGKTIGYTYEQFFVLIEIVEPERYKGIEVTLRLRSTSNRPMFADKVTDGKHKAILGATGKYMDQLEEYMLVAGILDDKYQPLEYKDNMLPQLQRIALHEDRSFQFTLKDGWIVPGSLIPYSAPEESIPFDADDVTTTPAPEFKEDNVTPPEFDDEEPEFEPEN